MRRFLRWQYVIIAAVLLLGIGSSSALVIALRQQEDAHLREDFEAESQDRITAVWNALEIDLLKMQSVAAFFNSSDEVTLREFNALVAPLVKNHSSIRVIEWAPRTRDAVGSSRYPISYAEPLDGHLEALGFDMASRPDCAAAMNRSRDTGELAATSSIRLPQEADNGAGLRLFLAVYRRNAPLDSVANRRKDLEGYVIGILHIKEIVDRGISGLAPAGIDVCLIDSSVSGHEQEIYLHRSRLDPMAHNWEAGARPRDLQATQTRNVAGRRWTIACAPVPRYIATRLTWYPCASGVAGLLITGLLASYLLGIAKRDARTAKLAAQLTESNRWLTQEIADHQAAETTLRKNQRQLQLFVENINDVIWTMDFSGRFIYMSPSIERLMQYTADEMRELAFDDLLTPPSSALAHSLLEQAVAAVQAGRPVKGHTPELEQIRKDGSTVWTEVSFSGMHDESGAVIAIQGIMRDISERKHAEETSKRDQAGTEALLKLSQISDRSADEIAKHAMERAISLTGSKIGYIAFASEDESVLTMHYWSKEAMHECAVIEKPIVYQTKDTGLWGEPLRQRKPIITNDYAAPNPLKKGTPPGHVHVTRHMNVPIFDGSRIVAVAGVGNKTQDYTDDDVRRLSLFMDGLWRILCRKRAEEQLQISATELKASNASLEKANQIAESANRAKSEFLANMSHEIRTPMTAILGYADLLLTEEGLDKAPPHRQQAFETIKRNGEHLLNVIGDILDLSKIEAERLQIEPVPSSPIQLVAEVISLMRPQAAAKNLQLKSELAGPLPETVLTDPLRLRQIVVNLLANAIKFTDQGQVRLTTRLSSDHGSPRLCFDVSDTGIGMNEEQIGKLFKPFSQVDNSSTRKFGGTGLGLCISKHLAEALGGSLEVRSQPGQGSTFSVTIDPGPLTGMHMIENAQESLLDRPSSTTAATPHKIALRGRILLAEDGPDNQRLIAMLLTKAGATVTAVDNGQQAVDAVSAARAAGEPFDLILMDMQMPVLDGYAATGQLRHGGHTGPIIALTAHAMSHDCQKCLDAGCDAYASKPIDRQKLLATVAPWLDRAQTLDESLKGSPA